jgi:hypothetical protein
VVQNDTWYPVHRSGWGGFASVRSRTARPKTGRSSGGSIWPKGPVSVDERAKADCDSQEGLAAAGFNFHLVLRWFAEFLDAWIAALLAMPLDEKPA